MTLGLLTALLGLALLDSTAFGTLLIPLWLLMAPGKVRLGRMAVYLGTVAGFYFVAGLAIAAGADVAVDAVREAVARIPDAVLLSTQAGLGLALVAVGLWWGVRSGRRDENAGPGRLQRWRDRAMTEAGGPGSTGVAEGPGVAEGAGEAGGTGNAGKAGMGGGKASKGGGNVGVMKLALIAVGLEIATMLPYLVSIGMLVNAQLGVVGYATWLGLYNVVMVLPAVLITVARFFWHRRLDPLLHRLNDHLARSSSSTVVWILVVLGVALAGHAAYSW